MAGRSNAGVRIPAARERNSRRRVDETEVETVAVVVEESFDRIGVRGFGVEVDGVIRVGEAMVLLLLEKES